MCGNRKLTISPTLPTLSASEKLECFHLIRLIEKKKFENTRLSDDQTVIVWSNQEPSSQNALHFRANSDWASQLTNASRLKWVWKPFSSVFLSVTPSEHINRNQYTTRKMSVFAKFQMITSHKSSQLRPPKTLITGNKRNERNLCFYKASNNYVR